MNKIWPCKKNSLRNLKDPREVILKLVQIVLGEELLKITSGKIKITFKDSIASKIDAYRSVLVGLGVVLPHIRACLSCTD